MNTGAHPPLGWDLVCIKPSGEERLISSFTRYRLAADAAAWLAGWGATTRIDAVARVVDEIEPAEAPL